eukprot:2871511-Prymnesium_polylepis.1
MRPSRDPEHGRPAARERWRLGNPCRDLLDGGLHLVDARNRIPRDCNHGRQRRVELFAHRGDRRARGQPALQLVNASALGLLQMGREVRIGPGRLLIVIAAPRDRDSCQGEALQLRSPDLKERLDVREQIF